MEQTVTSTPQPRDSSVSFFDPYRLETVMKFYEELSDVKFS
jgi:hypothetical protein